MDSTYPNDLTIIKKMNQDTKCVELHKFNGSVQTLPPEFKLKTTFVCQKCCRWFQLKIDYINHQKTYHSTHSSNI